MSVKTLIPQSMGGGGGEGYTQHKHRPAPGSITAHRRAQPWLVPPSFGCPRAWWPLFPIHPSIPSCWRCTRGDAEGGGPRGQHTKSAGAALGAPRPGAALGPGGARSSRGRRNKGGRRRAQQARNPAELWGRYGSPPRSPGGSHPPLSLRLFVL